MSKLCGTLANVATSILPSASERVVVFRYDKIGDLIVSSPLFRAIKEKQPDAFVLLVCSPYNKSVLENLPDIDRIVVYDPAACLLDKISFALALRRLKPTTAFVLSPSSGGHWMAWFSGAKRRAGMIMSYRRIQLLLAPLLLTVSAVVDKKKLERNPDRSFHQSEIALRLAAKCGFPRPKNVSQSAPTTKAARTWAARGFFGPDKPSRRILLHLGEAWRGCGLSEENVVGLFKLIHAKFPDFTLVMTAGPADQAYLTAMSRNFPDIVGEEPKILASPEAYPRALLFSGLSFDKWNALIGSAALVVTPDTGAVHLASAHKRPVVAVYAPARFNAMTSLFGPWETPNRTLHGSTESESLSAEIVSSMESLLN